MKLDLPYGSTAEQWEAAFRETEAAFARNKARRWVLQIFRDKLRDIVNPPPACGNCEDCHLCLPF